MGLNIPEVFTEMIAASSLGFNIQPRCSRSVYRNHSLGSSLGLSSPGVFTEITVWAQVCASELQKCSPKSQFGPKCAPQYSRSVHRNHSLGSSLGLRTPELFYRNHSLGSSVGLNIPEGCTEMTVWAQVCASMLQKCLPKRGLREML